MVLHEGETKNDEGREVPLSLRAVAILRSLRPREGNPRGRVFKKQPGTITAAFTRSRQAARAQYVKECRLKGAEPDPTFHVDLHLHDLRHEATSRLFEKELGTMDVASVTGHKTLSMLKRYTHLKAKRIAKKLG
jgi:integrase